jgi:undecaprenyl-diphosphatase
MMVDTYGMTAILTGFLTAFLSAVVAVKWMVNYLKRHGLALFGYYRVILAFVVAMLMASGVLPAD